MYLPSALWARMRASGGIELRLKFEGRVRHLRDEYSNLVAVPPILKEKLRRLGSCHRPRRIEDWCHLADAGDWPTLIASLLTVHYDPAYAASAKRCYSQVVTAVEIADASAETIDTLAEMIHGTFVTEVGSFAPSDSRQPIGRGAFERGHTDVVQSVAYHPDASRIATGSRTKS